MIAESGPRTVLLDTCAVIWLAEGSPLLNGAETLIFHAGRMDGIFVSPVSAWEIGMLNRRGAGRSPQFLPDPTTWFRRFMAGPAIKPAEFSADIAIASSSLPEPLHADPADRLLIATARHLSAPLVTRDAKIIAYAAAGHIGVISC